MALSSRVFVSSYPKNMNTLSLLLYVALRSIGIWSKGSTHCSMCEVVEHVSEVVQTSEMFCVAADVCPVGGTPGIFLALVFLVHKGIAFCLGRFVWGRVLSCTLVICIAGSSVFRALAGSGV